MTTDNHDPFALGGNQRDDAALLTLFREWREKLRLANESHENDGGGLDEEVWAIEEQICRNSSIIVAARALAREVA
jgi:hypothetical protein